jgi:hypothetical protein
VLGHFLDGLLVASIALFAGAVAESAATAAIIVLAMTIGSWVVDVAAVGQVPLASVLSSLSLTAVLLSFEHGSFPRVLSWAYSLSRLDSRFWPRCGCIPGLPCVTRSVKLPPRALWLVSPCPVRAKYACSSILRKTAETPLLRPRSALCVLSTVLC